MRHVLSRMALQLEGQRRCCFVLRERGTGVPMPKKPCGRVYLRLRRNCDLQTRYAVCGRSDGGAGRHWLLRGERAARLYREMPVNSIWEGSGNIMCLDVLRVLNKQAVYTTYCRKHCGSERQDRYLIARFVVYSSSCVSLLKNWGERLLISYSCWAAVRKC
ncbi:isovaleryl CoA dehydrogenase [Escherichia coli]|uniref:Isovaleryl CoA dehydrogenase n=1 Tax=Escherichia coli TaxID=562 RepID=A0A376MP98_ECOLX|nr:isovaleryl CoA dehydrogenase [Escherichia coli]